MLSNVKYTPARNLRELNAMIEGKIEYTGRFSETMGLHYGKMRQYRYEGSSEEFAIIFGSDIDSFNA